VYVWGGGGGGQILKCGGAVHAYVCVAGREVVQSVSTVASDGPACADLSIRPQVMATGVDAHHSRLMIEAGSLDTHFPFP